MYDYSHLGHARTYVTYDILVRYLRFKGYSTFVVVNITDIDDKILQVSRRRGQSPRKLTRKYERLFREDMRRLIIDSVNVYARASDYIDEIIQLIRRLLNRGFAYHTTSAIYFDTHRFRRYGRLSHQTAAELQLKLFEPDPEKRSQQDFSLWKKTSEGSFNWWSPWGRGRPGWHIEDTAIATTHHGKTYDLHGGASELIFPHHEAEIAQGEAAYSVRPYVRFWMHTGLLRVKGEKMSKSLGNFVTIRRILARFRPEALRLFFSLSHYRDPVDFRMEGLAEAEGQLERFERSIEQLRQLGRSAKVTRSERRLLVALRDMEGVFLQAMDDDLDTPRAARALLHFSPTLKRFLAVQSKVNGKIKEAVVKKLVNLSSILGILRESDNAQ